jgi:hypothetical protein
MKLTKGHVANVVRQYALELRRLALQVDWRVLACLLEMVALEADAVARSAGRRKRSRDSTAGG